jgi:hypothetical protein
VKSLILIINLLCLTACVEQVKQRVGALLGNPPAAVEDDSASYKPEPPPAVDQDKPLQITPKERVLTLFAQFNRTPDEALLGIVQSEFTVNKAQFGLTLDAALKTEINRSVANVQQGDKLTLRLLVQLLPQLQGENKEHLRGVIARGFDSAPGLTCDLLGKSGEDKLCILVNLVPPEVTPEAKKDFLESRLAATTLVKEDGTLSVTARLYADACVRTLQLALNMTPAETNGTQAVPDSAPAVAPVDGAASVVPAQAEDPAPSFDPPLPSP